MIDPTGVIDINSRREEEIPDEAVQLAKDLGMVGSEAMVARNYESLSKVRNSQQARALTEQAPVTRGMVSSPTAPMPFKYVPDAVELEREATPFFEYVGKKAEMGLAQQSGNQKIFDIMDRNPTIEQMNDLVSAEDIIQKQGLDLTPGGTASYLLGETAMMAGQILGDEDVQYGLAAQAVGTAAMFVPVPGAAIAGQAVRTVGAAGTRVAMLSNIYQLETGGAYREYRNIEGPQGKLDPETARYMAHAYGAISTVLEAVGFQKATGLSLLTKGALSKKVFAKKFMRAWQEEGKRKVIQDALTTIIKGPAAEGFTEAVQSLTQSVIGAYGEHEVGAKTDWNKAADDAWQSFKAGAAAAVVPAGVQAGVGYYLDRDLVKKAPAIAADVVTGSAKATGHDGNVHVDPQGAVILKQNMATNKVDNPELVKELETAIESGHTATVSMSDWIAAAAGIDPASIAKHVTADPSQATAAESEAVAAAKEAFKDEPIPETIEESPVYIQQLDAQLKAGVSMDLAQRNAKVAALWAHQWAREMGIPIEQVLADLTVGTERRKELEGVNDKAIHDVFQQEQEQQDQITSQKQDTIGLLPGAEMDDVLLSALNSPDGNASANQSVNDYFAKQLGYANAAEANAALLAEEEAYTELLKNPDGLKYLLADPSALSSMNIDASRVPEVIADAIADKKGLKILRDKEERRALEESIKAMSPEQLIDAINEAFDLGTASERAARRGMGVVTSLKQSNLKEGDTFQGESSRVGTALPLRTIKKVETYLHDTPENMVISMDKILADPVVAGKQATQIRAYDNFKPSRPDLTDEEVIREFKDHIKDNLLYLHDKMDPALREKAKQWYIGARKQVDLWMEEFGLEEQQVAAIIANLSPQKDWYQNMSCAERVMVIWSEHQDTKVDKKMYTTLEEVFSTDERGRPKKELSFNDKKMLGLWKKYGKGKTLREIEANTPEGDRDTVSAMFIRAYDEVYNPKHHRIIAPTGEMLGYSTSAKTGKRNATAWGSFGEIGKAVSAIRDPDLTKISERLGTAHKVRNFYNNIVSPDSLLGEVTIDTHAVAAGLFKALSANSHEVSHNFGSIPSADGIDLPPGITRSGPGNSEAQGISGIYGIFATAYREAAEARGLLPREMQSITWEEIRTVFTAEFKDNSTKVLAINAIWRQYKNGTITIGEAREAIEEQANVAEGRRPDWADMDTGPTGSAATGTGGTDGGVGGPDSQDDGGSRYSTYRAKLPGDGVPRQKPAGTAGRRGGDGAGKGRTAPTGSRLKQTGGADYRGEIQLGQGDFEGEFHIVLTGNADASTFLHEFGHYALEKYRRAVEDGTASELIAADYAKIQAFVGNTGEAITVDQHEKLAEAFESYFMEGKAPTPELEGTFKRLANLILKVYKNLKTRVDMNPDIRGVFDRMLVGQAQVTTAAAETIKPVEAAGIPLAMSDRIRRLAEEAYNAAQEIEMVRAMKKASNLNKKKYKAAEAKHRALVTDEVNAMPVYQADSFLTSGESPRVHATLWGRKLDTQAVKDMLGEDTIPATLAGRTSSTNPIHPDELAPYFGYVTGFEMIHDLIRRGDKAAVIKQRTDAAVMAELGDPNLDPSVINAGMDAVHNDKLEAYLMAELEALTGQKMSKRIQHLAALQRAREILSKKKRSEMYPAKYYRASATQAGLAVEAARAGNHLKAADHIRNQILNHHLFRESTAQTQAFDKKVRKLKGYDGMKSMRAVRKGGAAYKNNPADIIPIVLGKLGLTQDIGGDPAALIRELSAELDEKGLANPLVDVPTEAYVDHRIMTYDQLMAIAGNVQALVKIGKEANEVRLEQERIKLDALINEFTAQADTNLATKQWAKEAGEFQGTDPSVYRNFRKGLNTFHGLAMKLQSACTILDGGDANGPFNRIFIAPLDRLESQSQDLKIELGKQLDDIAGDLFQQGRMQESVTFMGKPMTRASALMVVMNIGNETNLSRVVNGNLSDDWIPNEDLEGWKARIITEAEHLLQPMDIRIAFDMAKIMDRYGRLAEVVERVQGQILERVQPVPLTIHGITSPGYYFPIDYADKPSKPKRVGEQPMAVGAAAMANSAIKPRTKYSTGELALNASAIPAHLSQVIHIEVYYQHLMALDKIINNPRFATLISEKLGPSVYRMTFKDLLTVIATNGNAIRFAMQASKTAETMLRRVRRNTTTFRLGFNLGSAVKQFYGLIGSVALMGPTNTVRGLFSMLNNQNFRDLKSWTDAKSPMMKHRIETYNANMFDVMRDTQGLFGGKAQAWADEYAKAAFIPMQSAQGLVDYLTWNTAYASANSRGETDARAIRYADDIVSRSQGTGGIHHRTPAESSGELIMMFNMHYSYWGTAYGQLASAVTRLTNNSGGAAEALKVVQESAIYWVGPAFAASAYAMMGDDDDDDDGNLLVATAIETVKAMKATLPFIRSVPLSVFGIDDFAGQSPLDIVYDMIGRINVWNGWTWSESRLVAQTAASLPASYPIPADKAFLLVATVALMGKGEFEAGFGYFMGLKKWREVAPLLQK